MPGRSAPARVKTATGGGPVEMSSEAAMFNKLRALWNELRERCKHSREIAPRTIRDQAAELRELAEIAERVAPVDAETLVRLRRIRHEMNDLMDLTRRPEFHRIPAQRRLDLHNGIQRTREQILESAQAAPTPTPRLQ